jgi:hypothetical protein
VSGGFAAGNPNSLDKFVRNARILADIDVRAVDTSFVWPCVDCVACKGAPCGHARVRAVYSLALIPQMGLMVIDETHSPDGTPRGAQAKRDENGLTVDPLFLRRPP